MSDLERDYRRALAWYPRPWRRNHEEALLGVLLDRAEAEGRHSMSKAERRDLAATSMRLRISATLPYAVLSVAALALLSTASLLLGGAPPDSAFLISPPAIPAPPIGGSYQPLFVIQQSGWALCAISVGVLVAATFAGLSMFRRNRRADRAQ